MKTGIAAILIWLAMVGLVGYGWVLNLIDVVHSNFSNFTGELLVRCIGIVVVPLGSIMGWFF